MISIEQCRGARGVLGWTQQELADASGLSKTAINNFEKGHSDIKVESLKAIQMAFESADIEFLGQGGLRRKSQDTKIFSGDNAFAELFKDIHECAGPSSEILVLSSQLHNFSTLHKKQKEKYNTFLENGSIRKRVLCSEGKESNEFVNCEYRFLPEAILSGCTTSYLYDTKIALELWDRDIIVVINSADAHRAERNRFEYFWNQALALENQNEEKQATG